MMHKSGRNDTATPGASVKRDKKLSCQEWCSSTNLEDLFCGGLNITDIVEKIWKAAQENK